MTLRSIQLRIEALLSSRKAVATSVIVAFLALVLAVYVEVRQINLTDCLAAYNDAAARASAARARIATEDRAVDVSDRDAIRRNEEALDALLRSMSERAPEAERHAAFANLIRVRAESRKTRDANQRVRNENEAERRRNPIPQPPSETCR